MRITAIIVSLIVCSQSFAALVTECTFKNGRVFIDSSFEIFAQSDARRYTDFNGTFHVFLTEEHGNYTEVRTYERWGHINSNDEKVLVVYDALPYRLKSCQVVFSGEQSDR